jgi:AhpD family alkylhydroperoxidase
MTTPKQELSEAQKELVAVGASVGAGCQPCVSHHLKAGAKAGLEGEQLLASVVSAERVNAEAAVAMGDHARAGLGPTVASPALLMRLEEALASLGAALGANDKTNIERQLRAAAQLGATRSQLEQAIETAHTVQENAARIHLREAERLLDAIAHTTAAAARDADPADHGGGRRGDAVSDVEESRDADKRVTASKDDGSDEDCGCGADDTTEETPTSTEETESTSATSGHTGGFGWTPARPAAVGASGAMAGCREMFKRFMSAAPATSEQGAPTATTASGPCKKEA